MPIYSPSSIKDIDSALKVLQSQKQDWIRVSVDDRIGILQKLIRRTVEIAPRWVEAGIKAKQLPETGIRAAQEWIAGPYTIVRNLRRLEWALRNIQRYERPRIPGPITKRSDGQVVCRIIPQNIYDRVFFPGITADVWMQPDVTNDNLIETQARAYQVLDQEGRISLVLGAGNISGIAPTDVLYKLFVENQVVLLKTSPVNSYFGLLVEEWFSPLVESGFLRIVHGGPDEGSYMCNDPRIFEIHVTGSDKTYDSIVFGTGPEGSKRKEEHNPLLDKQVTGELGNVCPAIVVPGPWSESDLEYHTELLASAMNDNGGFTCSIPRIIVQHSGWNLRNELLDNLRSILSKEPLTTAYYPGAKEKHQAFLADHPEIELLGKPRADQIPWTMITDLNPGNSEDICFKTEPFFGFIGETALDAPDPATFLDKAVEFANDRLWGTLSAVILIHPRSLQDRKVAAALDRALAKLRYGQIGINYVAGASWVSGVAPWGPFPNDDISDIQSGNNFVHNTLMFSKPQKTILKAPFRIKPKPLWFSSRGIAAQKVFRKLVDFEVSPSILKMPAILLDAIK